METRQIPPRCVRLRCSSNRFPVAPVFPWSSSPTERAGGAGLVPSTVPAALGQGQPLSVPLGPSPPLSGAPVLLLYPVGTPPPPGLGQPRKMAFTHMPAHLPSPPTRMPFRSQQNHKKQQAWLCKERQKVRKPGLHTCPWGFFINQGSLLFIWTSL